MLNSSAPYFLDHKTPWLVEIMGPQHSGKTSIADLVALILEDNGIKCLRVEEDSLIYAFFTRYVKLRSIGHRDEAHNLLNERRPFLTEVSSAIIKKGLDAGYTIIHDHITKNKFREGVCKSVAKDANSGYLSVFLSAPLDKLEERWKHRGTDDGRIKELEDTYRHLQVLREEAGFGLNIDTYQSSAVEAAKQIVSRIYPGINVNVIEAAMKKHKQRISKIISETQQPIVKLENVQLVRTKDAVIMIHRHKRFVIEENYFKILQLLDGHNTVEQISKKAKEDLNKVKNFVQFLCEEKMAVV